MIRSVSRRTVDRDRRARTGFLLVAVMLSLCVLGNMILIFCMSAEGTDASADRSNGVTDAVVDVVYPNLNERPIEEQETIFQKTSHLVRKMAHFSEFALLGFLTALLVRHLSARIRFLRPLLQWTIPAVFCLLYAVSDEVHQIFSGRGPAVKDVLIDFAGALFGQLTAHLLIRLFYRLMRACSARRTHKKHTV